MLLAVKWGFLSLLKHYDDTSAVLLFSVSRLKSNCSKCTTSDLAKEGEKGKKRCEEDIGCNGYPLLQNMEDGKPCDDFSPPP